MFPKLKNQLQSFFLLFILWFATVVVEGSSPGFPEHCPKSYLLVGIKYGRLNNHLMSLAKAAAYASALNRTLIIGCKHIHLEKYFDFSPHSCIMYWTMRRKKALMRQVEVGQLRIPTFYRGQRDIPSSCYFGRRGVIPKQWSKFIPVSSKATNEIDVLRQINQAIAGQPTDNHIIAFPWPFKMPLSDGTLSRWLRAFPFKPELISIAEAFIARNFPLNGTCFVAVHSRNFEGNCGQQQTKPAKAGSVYESAQCAIQHSQILGILQAKKATLMKHDPACARVIFDGRNKKFPLFLATDKQDPKSDQQLRESAGAKSFSLQAAMKHDNATSPLLDLVKYPAVLPVIDMIICSKSWFFIGNAASTLSTNIRRLRGSPTIKSHLI